MKLACSPETEARDRATLYEFLAAGLRAPRGPFLAALREPAFLTSSLVATSRLSHDLVHAFTAARNRLLRESDQALALVHRRVFEDGHECPACETDHVADGRTFATDGVAGVMGFYSAFGLRIAEDLDERIDHVGVECEFMGWLCALEAAAFAQDLPAEAGLYRAAQREFLQAHLGRFLAPFCSRLRRHESARGRFLEALADLASTFVVEEARGLGATISPGSAPLRIVLPSIRERDPGRTAPA